MSKVIINQTLSELIEDSRSKYECSNDLYETTIAVLSDVMVGVTYSVFGIDYQATCLLTGESIAVDRYSDIYDALVFALS